MTPEIDDDWFMILANKSNQPKNPLAGQTVLSNDADNVILTNDAGTVILQPG